MSCDDDLKLPKVYVPGLQSEEINIKKSISMLLNTNIKIPDVELETISMSSVHR